MPSTQWVWHRVLREPNKSVAYIHSTQPTSAPQCQHRTGERTYTSSSSCSNSNISLSRSIRALSTSSRRSILRYDLDLRYQSSSCSIRTSDENSCHPRCDFRRLSKDGRAIGQDTEQEMEEQRRAAAAGEATSWETPDKYGNPRLVIWWSAPRRCPTPKRNLESHR